MSRELAEARPVPDVYRVEALSSQDGIPVFSHSDRYTQNYEQISADHLEFFRKEGRNPFINEAHWRDCEDSTAQLVQRYARDGAMILDVGVGMGRLLGRFPQLRRFGVDISFGYLAHARAAGIDVCYARIEELPYRHDLFDLITCTDVLEHVLDLNLALARILAVLKPGGKLILRVPYREDLSSYLAPGFPYEFVHLRNFDEHSLRLLVERICGQKTVEQTLAGYRAGSLRVGARIPKLEMATKLTLNVVEARLPRLARAVAALRGWALTATEINVVVEKR